MKSIPLTKGLMALVDDEDFEFLNQWKWCASLSARGFPYAMRAVNRGGDRQRISMHRLIMKAPPELEVDHIDHDGLNNQRENLRLATRLQNAANLRHRPHNVTGFRGVTPKRSGKYEAAIFHAGKRRYLGVFHFGVDAARTYDAPAFRLKGEYASTNQTLGIIE